MSIHTYVHLLGNAAISSTVCSPGCRPSHHLPGGFLLSDPPVGLLELRLHLFQHHRLKLQLDLVNVATEVLGGVGQTAVKGAKLKADRGNLKRNK